MRKILFLRETVFHETELYYWNKITQRLADLPSRPIRAGEETRFSTWLSKGQIDSIQQATTDELSGFLSDNTRDMRTFNERAPTEPFIRSALASAANPMTPSTLEEYATACSRIPRQKIRVFRHFSSPDSRGACQEFVTPAQVPKAIEEFCDVWNGGEDLRKKPVPIWLFVALLNAHPFGDGNGRLARALLNVLLIKNGLVTDHIIPFGPLIYATRGNFELAMGRAAIMNKWEPIVRVFFVLISFYADVYEEFGKAMASDYFSAG